MRRNKCGIGDIVFIVQLKGLEWFMCSTTIASDSALSLHKFDYLKVYNFTLICNDKGFLFYFIFILFYRYIYMHAISFSI